MLLTELPTYLYHHEELPFRGDGTLFHYTKFDKLLDILDSLTVRPSQFGTLNDMNEGNINNLNMNENFSVMYEVKEYINDRCKLLCFSQNFEIGGYGHEGTNHPAMWAHYADNSNGACVVIDKDAFINKNKTIFDTHYYKFDDVEYSMFNAPSDEEINYKADTAEEFIKNNCKALFFLKHKDWENEDEHRLFIMDYNGSFSIDGCIKYIVLGRKIFLDENKIKSILDRVVNPKSLCFHKLIPHSFATTCYDNHGYSTFEIASKIDLVVQSNLADKLYADYDRWLSNEQGYI